MSIRVGTPQTSRRAWHGLSVTGRLIRFEPWDRPPQPLESQTETAALLFHARSGVGQKFLIYADADNMTLEQSGARRLANFPAALQGEAMAIFLWPGRNLPKGVISGEP